MNIPTSLCRKSLMSGSCRMWMETGTARTRTGGAGEIMLRL